MRVLVTGGAGFIGSSLIRCLTNHTDFLVLNIDILTYVSNHNSMRPKLVIGFAAETNDLEDNAIEKLKNKNCDMIIANDVSNQNIGFNSDFNEVTIFYRTKKKEKLFLKNKSSISEEIVERVDSHLN